MNVLKARSILGLSDNWTDDELKKNYRTLAMKFHPDKCKTHDSSKFVEIQQAYEYLNGQSMDHTGMDNSSMDDILLAFQAALDIEDDVKQEEALKAVYNELKNKVNQHSKAKA
jgi:hypothetical protein